MASRKPSKAKLKRKEFKDTRWAQLSKVEKAWQKFYDFHHDFIFSYRCKNPFFYKCKNKIDYRRKNKLNQLFYSWQRLEEESNVKSSDENC